MAERSLFKLTTIENVPPQKEMIMMLRGTRLQYVRRAQYFVLVFLLLAINVSVTFCLVGFDMWRNRFAFVAVVVLANILVVIQWRKNFVRAERRAKLVRPDPTN
jgi:membrane protein YdbS with pleckstrin-like domain